MSRDLFTTYPSPNHPADIGELWLESHQPDDTHPARWITILRADPVIFASQAILDEIAEDGGSWYSPARIDGDLFKVEAENLTVIYRIMEQSPRNFCRVLRWPD